LSVAVHPNARGFHDFSPFGTGHRLEGTPERRATTGFDLEERDEMTSPGDQVQLDPADAKAMRDDFPATTLQKADRRSSPARPRLWRGSDQLAGSL